MDITKVKAAVDAARKNRTPQTLDTIRATVKTAVEQTLIDGKKDNRQFSGLMDLGKVDGLLDKVVDAMKKDRVNELFDKVVSRLDAAVKRTAPKAPKAPKPVAVPAKK